MEVHLIRSFAHYKRAGRGTPLRLLRDTESPFKSAFKIQSIKVAPVIPDLGRFVREELKPDRFSTSRVIYCSKVESLGYQMLTDRIEIKCTDNPEEKYLCQMTLDYLGRQYYFEEFPLDKQFYSKSIEYVAEDPFEPNKTFQTHELADHLAVLLKLAKKELKVKPVPGSPIVVRFFVDHRMIEHSDCGLVYLYQDKFVLSIKEMAYQLLCCEYFDLRYLYLSKFRDLLVSMSEHFDFFRSLDLSRVTKKLSDNQACRHTPNLVLRVFKLYWTVQVLYGHEDRKPEYLKYYIDYHQSLKRCFKNNKKKRSKGSLTNLDHWILFADEFIQLVEQVDEGSDTSFTIWEIVNFIKRSGIPKSKIPNLSGHFMKMQEHRMRLIPKLNFASLSGSVWPQIPQTRSGEVLRTNYNYSRITGILSSLIEFRPVLPNHTTKITTNPSMQNQSTFQMSANLDLNLDTQQNQVQVIHSETKAELARYSIAKILNEESRPFAYHDCGYLVGYRQRAVVTLGNFNQIQLSPFKRLHRIFLESDGKKTDSVIALVSRPIVQQLFRAEATWGSRFLRVFSTKERQPRYEITRLSKNHGAWVEESESQGDFTLSMVLDETRKTEFDKLVRSSTNRELKMNNRHAVLAFTKPGIYGNFSSYLVAWDYTKMSETNPQTPNIFEGTNVLLPVKYVRSWLFLGRSGAIFHLHLIDHLGYFSPLYGLVAFHQGKFAELVTERPLFKSPLPASFSAGQHVVQFDARHLRLLFWWSEKRWVPFREGEDRAGSPEDGRFEFFAHVKVAKFLF